MRLSELAKPTEHKLLGQDVEVGELQYNSRKVKACLLYTSPSPRD